MQEYFWTKREMWPSLFQVHKSARITVHNCARDGMAQLPFLVVVLYGGSGKEILKDFSVSLQAKPDASMTVCLYEPVWRSSIIQILSFIVFPVSKQN